VAPESMRLWYGSEDMGRVDPPRRVDVTALGGAACGIALFRLGERLHVTVIVKASFEFIPDGAMSLVPADEIVTAEAHHHNNPARSVRVTPDTAPFLPRADVVLTGHARPPEGRAAEALVVRLALFRGAPLLDKAILVRGDTQGDATLPFEKLPLVYERAYGGIGWEENPLGVGAGVASASKAPNLIDPDNHARVMCFAPVSRAFPRRKRLLGKTDRRALDRPIAEIPAAFDWSYFQAAPEDQQVGYLQGDEWLILQGFHPVYAELRSCLPSARALARVYGIADAGDGHPLALAADTLRIDADALRCSVTWRGSFPIPHDDALAAIRVVAGVETPVRRITWPSAVTRASSADRGGRASAPDRLPEAQARAGAIGEHLGLPGETPDTVKLASTHAMRDALPADRSDEPSWNSTLTLDLPEESSPVARAAAPFRAPPAAARATAAPKEAPRAPAVPIVAPRPAPALHDFNDTLTVDDDPEELRAAAVGLPFPAPPRPRAPSVPPLPPASSAPRAVPAKKARPVAHGITLVNDTGLALGVVPWGASLGRDCLTVLAKATCDLIPGDLGALRPEAEPLEGERFEDGVCVYPSDFAPFKVRADVTLAGHVYAPIGGAPSQEVSFRFGDEANGFTRRLIAFGERRWEKGLAGPRASAPKPFDRMPLCPDRAFGGPRFPSNPSGIGYPDRMRPSRGPSLLPNLEDPERRIRTPNQAPPPSFLSPIPRAWKARTPSAERRTPFLAFPEALDWTSHQAAPPEQQLAFLRGDEAFAVTPVLPDGKALTGALPGLRARCFTERRKGDKPASFEEIPLRLDTVTFEVERRVLTLVFRGALPVPDERAPSSAIDVLYLVTEPLTAPPMTLEQARRALLRR
jgi:hypothetical protein